MKKICFLFSMILLVTNLNAQNDFRQFKWGDTLKKIKETEKAKLIIKHDAQLAFEGTLTGEEVLIAYDFIDEKLCTGTYIFSNDHLTTTHHIKLYNNIKIDLNNKYGDMIGEDKRWFNTTFKDMPELKEMAILSGHLEYNGHWENDRTELNLILTGKNTKSQLMLLYRSKELFPLWYKKMQQSSNEL